jgi:glycosyltransferase involved in cell wall biosynthesis
VTLPRVTALVTVYNRERFVGEALDSALGQDYPADLLDVLVVDDGSSDGSAREIARRAGPRLRVVRQENAGYVAASVRALDEGEGELFALLDADDVWPRDKIRRQVAALGDALLLYGDMTVIDAAGAVLQESWLGDDPTPAGGDFATLLGGNAATSSSILARAAAVRRWSPLPPGIAFVDWYLAMRAALEGGLAYLPEPRTLYRFHGDNMGLGSSGARRAGQLRSAVAFQRWFLRRLPDAAPPADLLRAWHSFESFALELMRAADTPFTPLVAVGGDDRAAAGRLARRAARRLERGDATGALALALRAAAADPWSDEARTAAACARDACALSGRCR